MGCQPSQQNQSCLQSELPQTYPQQIKLNIVDSTFMKPQNQSIRSLMQKQNITYENFISLEYFFEEFSKRYYNKIVTSYEHCRELARLLEETGMTPYVYVVGGDGKKLEEGVSRCNWTSFNNYAQLITYLKTNQSKSISSQALASCQNTSPNKNQQTPTTLLKILTKSSPKNSSNLQIFITALKKFSLPYQHFTSYQMLQQSALQSYCDYVVTDYIYHKEVVQLFKKTKTKVYCYCSFQGEQSYAPELYSVSNNYLDIANDIRSQVRLGNKGMVRCSKVYMNSTGLVDCEEIKSVLEAFDIQVRLFTNYQKVIKQTTYFFCVTVIAAQSQSKNLTNYFQTNSYLQRIKLLTIPPNTPPTLKHLYKLLRNVKKGYHTQKSITSSIDIIDKHYNSIKFQQIKRELQNNEIKCFGYANLNQYIKNKKFISSFIICNYEERMLLVRYMKQLQCRAKIIIFCNKNNIGPELRDNISFAFVSSHFGKIIKFIRKTLVFLPKLDRQDQLLFKQKIDKIKTKNKRISALKWSQPELGSNNNNQDTLHENFQFLNIAKQTTQNSIKDLQKSISQIWKSQTTPLTSSFTSFKTEFIKSLTQLKKLHKINFSELQFNQLIEKIKVAGISQLLEKVKSFFDADNQLGLEINKSLMKTQSLEKKQICNMREFLLLVFLNYFSGFMMPRIGKKVVMHWVGNSLIQKCQIGSYLFCKHFLIFYDNNNPNLTPITKYKLELSLNYNTLLQQQLFLNSFITYKDKIIFCPFSQFQIEKIENAGQFKIITVRFVKNVEFLKYIFQDNLGKSGSGDGIASFVQALLEDINKGTCQLIDEKIKDKLLNNLDRITSLQNFQKGSLQASIQTHKKLIKQNQQKQNLDSYLINQLNFQLACFYFKANRNRQAANTIKQLLESDPGEFIRVECEKMIQEVVGNDNSQQHEKDEIQQQPGDKLQTQNNHNKENQPPSSPSPSPKTPKTRRISEQAMKTFVWLKNKQQQKQDSICSQEQNQQNIHINQFEINKFQGDMMKCMEICDLEEDMDVVVDAEGDGTGGKENVMK